MADQVEQNEQAKATAGPWFVGEENCGDGANVIDARGRRLAHSAATRNMDGKRLADGNVIERAEAIANARLIAAAPDLLMALKSMVASYDGLRDALTSPVVLAKLAAADAAIAKAEGRS